MGPETILLIRNRYPCRKTGLWERKAKRKTIIRAGAQTKTRLKEKKQNVDAHNVTKVAVEEGIVDRILLELRRALGYPMKLIAKNVGQISLGNRHATWGHGDEGGGESWRSLRCLFSLYMAVFGQPTSIPIKWLSFTNRNSDEAQTSWAYAFHQDKASSVRVPVANVTLSSSAHLLRENTDSVRSSGTGSLPSGRVDLTGDEDPTDEDGDTGIGYSTGVLVSLGGEISSGGKKSRE
ncbi:hypothetical protein Tco_0606249 [Tanacetum coccineum]